MVEPGLPAALPTQTTDYCPEQLTHLSTPSPAVPINLPQQPNRNPPKKLKETWHFPKVSPGKRQKDHRIIQAKATNIPIGEKPAWADERCIVRRILLMAGRYTLSNSLTLHMNGYANPGEK
jgi:hypothetical protein